MKKLIPFAWLLLGATLGCAQSCPVVLNCTQGTQVYCDFSSNDSLLWNVPTFTKSIDHQLADLYEGVASLNLKIIGCSDSSALHVSFNLFLDLNQDNLEETVICSKLLPQPGYFMANNAFTENYAGGDMAMFDARNVSDSLRYTFDLQLLNAGDTTIASICWHNLAFPNALITPRLPEGKHRIVWTVQQDSFSTSCEYLIRIRDCSNPLVLCKDALTVAIDPDAGFAKVPFEDLLDYVEDNVTPHHLLQYSLRRSSSVTGFPIDSLGLAVPELHFGCAFTESTQTVEVWVKDKAGNTSFCESVVNILPSPVACALALPKICAVPYNNPNLSMDGLSYELLWTLKDSQECKYTMPMLNSACTELDSFPATNYFSIRPTKNTNPLNGVSTYDLLLISKHILNIEPLNAAWKIVAADANRSGSVTNFDIVELRKLLLGIYEQLPNSASWRFYAAYCQFPPNPFAGWCPWVLTLENLPLENYDASYYFYGLKTGDVNGNAQLVDSLIGQETHDRAVQMLETNDSVLEPGTVVSIPFYVKDGAYWSGCQLELNFDPALMQIEQIVPGVFDNLRSEHFAQPQLGQFTMSWFDVAPSILMPDYPLFTLQVRTQERIRLSEVLKVKTDRIAAEAYQANGGSSKLELSFDREPTEPHAQTIWSPKPNPTGGAADIAIDLKATEQVSLTLMDMAGHVVYQFSDLFEPGPHLLSLPALVLSNPGVYSWRVVAGVATATGKLVRL